MNRIPVDSSNIVSIGYESGLLEVEFKNGTYQYPGVSEELAGAFMASDSKGKFFSQFIRPGFQGEKV